MTSIHEERSSIQVSSLLGYKQGLLFCSRAVGSKSQAAKSQMMSIPGGMIDPSHPLKKGQLNCGCWVCIFTAPATKVPPKFLNRPVVSFLVLFHDLPNRTNTSQILWDEKEGGIARHRGEARSFYAKILLAHTQVLKKC